MDASIAQVGSAGAASGPTEAADAEAALFDRVLEQAKSMIAWARSADALALEHDKLEEKTLADGYELMRRLTEAHTPLRAAREQRRDDVTDVGGKVRATAERGQEHTRVMIYGAVRTSRPGTPVATASRHPTDQPPGAVRGELSIVFGT